ncbi:DUF523 domain-containing protein [Lacrimispora sphenoides]|uniref:Uncharacterized conserved protein YbbK, DUF523 family n=1 Tax=Lacrimispora sphenoides JCM 1415 TaxID=1297793 RepID=A0ABY1CEI9_9FIRM|nr:DUF523 domain-containing protein [Lacrimispora sphenoides]SET97101.1 Uncharacterized conserved protein YbbK, DUF523 family [[Clostridium] sphenoides JCM 1415]SUY52839.1 purine nucleoside phosphorylase [Lacrimispora sphenoides]
MKVLVSACILGRNYKYNGGNNLNPKVMEFLKNKEIIEICPEILAGMNIPRATAEIVNGCVTEINGKNVHNEYTRAVELALEMIKSENIDLAILQSRSPTCGVNKIYNGCFNGILVQGNGLFAKALIDRGIKVLDSDDFS